MLKSTPEKTSDVDEAENLEEQLKCPICFHIPSAEIYQCSNGHIICQKCLCNIDSGNCPQCRISFPDFENLIRVRALESLVQSIKVSCSYHANGCTEKVQRKHLQRHEKDCTHNGMHIQFCKRLGYNCSHWTNAMNNDSITDHFRSHHNAVVVNDNCVNIQIVNFRNVTKTFKKDGIWTPTLINTAAGLQFIILTLFHYKDKTVSWVAFQMSKVENQEIKNKIQVRIGSQFSKSHPFAWEMIPLSLFDLNFAEYDVRKFAIQRIPVAILCENYIRITAAGENIEKESMLQMCFRTGGAVYSQTFPKAISEIIPITKYRERVSRSNLFKEFGCKHWKSIKWVDVLLIVLLLAFILVVLFILHIHFFK